MDIKSGMVKRVTSVAACWGRTESRAGWLKLIWRQLAGAAITVGLGVGSGGGCAIMAAGVIRFGLSMPLALCKRLVAAAATRTGSVLRLFIL